MPWDPKEIVTKIQARGRPRKRATAYEAPEVHRALRPKAVAPDRLISEMVNEAVRASLAEDAEDLAAFDERRHERTVSFESFVQGLKRRGRQ